MTSVFYDLKETNMTKEEILIKALNDRCKYESSKVMDYDTHLAIMDAMDEYAQQQAKNCVIPAVIGELTCDSCGCHPNVIYTTSRGRFCEGCKPAS